MKKAFSVLLFFTTAVIGWAQAFSDLAYPNPDFMSYFQQETTSLLKFQVKNNITIPFFVSGSYRGLQKDYEYKEIMSFPYYREDIKPGFDNDIMFNIFGGFQIKITGNLYIPIIGGFSFGEFQGLSNTMITKDRFTYALKARGEAAGFAGYSGLVINTAIIQGGIYAGYKLQSYRRSLEDDHWIGDDDGGETVLEKELKHGFSMALVPAVDTSKWVAVGKVLNKFFGYIGLGNDTVFYPESSVEGLSPTEKAFLKALNYGLDFAFSKIHFDFLTLTPNAFFEMNNYDTASRNETYGIEVRGLFTSFPLGFGLEGGYLRFVNVPRYLESNYPNSGYFKADLSYSFRHFTIGAAYTYDKLTKSTFTLALTTNFLSAFYALTPSIVTDKDVAGQRVTASGIANTFGVRYRHGGWRAGQE